jgi:hypothetical protein
MLSINGLKSIISVKVFSFKIFHGLDLVYIVDKLSYDIFVDSLLISNSPLTKKVVSLECVYTGHKFDAYYRQYHNGCG